jgi:hypothetical protein
LPRASWKLKVAVTGYRRSYAPSWSSGMRKAYKAASALEAEVTPTVGPVVQDEDSNAA